MIVTITQQMPLQVRDYTDKSGIPQHFRTVGLLLRSGFDTFYAEAVQEQADTLSQYPVKPNAFYKVQLTATGRNFVDAKGVKRWQTELRVNKLTLM